MNGTKKTIYDDLVFEFDKAVDAQIHEQFPDLDPAKKNQLLVECAVEFKAAATKIVEKLYAHYCYEEAAR